LNIRDAVALVKQHELAAIAPTGGCAG
jgi:hypothetical protein